MHLWHEKNNAVFVDAGLWLRPRYYKQGSETLQEAAKREAANVRKNVGICDVTSLGKILGSVSAIFGSGFFALPAGLLDSEFYDEMQKEKSFVPIAERNYND